ALGFRDLHTAALAAAARVDLRLDHPHLAAQLARGLDRLVDGEAGNAARRGDAVLAQDLFRLVLVDFHGLLSNVGLENCLGARRTRALMAVKPESILRCRKRHAAMLESPVS